MTRPSLEAIKNGDQFDQWYWTKEELIRFCKMRKIPSSGTKAILRARIIDALNNGGTSSKNAKKIKVKNSKFNWAKADLSPDTVITDNISFGPNFRGFMKSHLGKKFSCHSDFMDWVKQNIGKTLGDALVAWENLEARKKDPNFQRDIAMHNRLALYVRAFLADNPDAQFKDAFKFWHKKRQLPAKGGLVSYEPSDLDLN